MENYNGYEEVDLMNLVKITARGKKIILVCFVIGLLVIAGMLVLKNIGIIPSTYEAVSVIEVGYVDWGGVDGTVNRAAIEAPDELVGKINYGVFNKGTNLNPGDIVSASIVLDTRMIEIKVSSKSQERAKGYSSDLVSAVLLEQDDLLESYKNQINQKIARAEQTMVKFTAMGQQVSGIQLRDFDLHNQLDSIVLSSLVDGPNVSHNKQNIISMLVIGAVLGIFIGFVVIFIKEWWNKNKSRAKEARI